VNPDSIGQVLRDYYASHTPAADPELEALRTAIFLEDVFGIALSDPDIDPAVLGDPSAVAALVARLRDGG
jgi:hypothetical protein